MGTALITGGTSGIGAAYARALAERGDDLVLVARDHARLEDVAARLRSAHGVEVEILQADLADRTQVMSVVARLESSVDPITTFINNAGFGLHTDLLTSDTAEDERAFEVMVRAVYLLGGAAARSMLRRGGGEIINTASSAAFITTGNYSAIKSWVLIYSEGLATQLRGSKVHVTAFCPGWIHTEFHERAEIEVSKLPPIVWIDGDKAVREALTDVAKGKVICVPGPIGWKAAVVLARFAPRWMIRWASSKLVKSRAKDTDVR
ncbi:SDR family NAD(P)-dependent oxidoreductase [Raineyella fluvialis]|uniref:SDR family NAD(P)-dependent oxidoreductase n=1 Tax=Raineyella fluvialis TaxID=2662261 RepID=A0A5Q2F8D2_9ACTN|nr:SDR family oxidoreductase [Raineyella fluvialis]QGF23220.1 SDR family NAD(P)-dependent oxidoreductase [Raineyella fluvialis]